MKKNPPFCVVAALLLLACGASPALAQQPSPLAVPILFDNQTGLDPSQIYIQFLGGYPISGTYKNSATGVATSLSADPGVSYSLAQLQGLGAYSANNTKGVTQTYANTPGILVDNLDSGRVYLNFGTQGLVNPTMASGYTPEPYSSVDPNYATRWQYFETTIKNGQVWADLSYIDFTSISFSLNATNAPNGGNTNQISANATTLVNATLASATSDAASLPVAGAVLPNPQFARVISPQYTVGNNQTVYGDFTNYLASLNGKTSTISGLFAGVGGELGAPTTQAQIYDYTASFSGTDGNGTVTLIANPNSGTGNYANIADAIAPGKNTNGGFGVGSNITITIKYTDLIDPKGIYGSNPPYTVNGTVTQNNTGIVNDVFGRVVGDLLAGLTFGTVGSNVSANLTIGNGTIHNLNGPIGSLSSSVWWASGNGTNLQWIPFGDTLYSVAWNQSLAGSSNGTLLYGGAQPGGNSTINTPYYNYYSAALVGPTNDFNTPLTPGYGTPFGDRIGNNLLTFDVSKDTQGFMILTINPDSGSGIPASLWTGGNGSSWDTLSNWKNNNGGNATQIPAGNATIQFLGTAGSSTSATVDVGGAREVAAISFRYGAQPFTLQNGTITLNGYQQGGFFPVGANIVNSSLHAQTIENDLFFTSNGTLAAVNGNLTLSGTITNNATLTNTGGNTTTLSGNVSGSGGFSQTGTGTLALTGSGNTFNGGLSISNGTIALGATDAAGTGTITLTGGTLAAQGGGNYTFTNSLVLNGSPTITGQGSLAFTGGTTMSNSTVFTANAPVSLNGILGATGNNTANYTLTVAGNASLTLGGSSANTYNGSFAVTSGTLELAKTGNATSVFNNLTIGGTGSPATVLVSTENQIQLPGTTTSSITLNPGATLALGSNSLNLSTTTQNMSAQMVFYGGNVTGNGTVSTFGNTASIQFLGSGNTTSTIASNFSLQNSTLTGNAAGNFTAFNVFSNDAPVQLTVTGDLSGPGGLSKGDAGTLWLQGNNTYTGGTSLAGGVLAANSLGSGGVVFAGGGLSPGGLNQTSNLTAEGGVTFSKGFLLFDLAGGNSSDVLTVNGTFTNSANGTKILFVFNNDSTPSGNFSYTLASNFDPTAGNYTYTSANIPGLVGNFLYSSGNLTFSGAAGVNATWTGTTDGTWATGTNWQSNTVPAPGTEIFFGNATNRSVDTITNRTTGSITFLAGAQAYTISNNTITLGGDLTNNSSATQTVNSTLAINWDRSFNAASGNLVLANIDLGTANRVNTATFQTAANQNITVAGTISDEFSVSPSVPYSNIVKTGPGTLLITGSAAHFGATTLEEGVLAAAGTIGNLSQASQIPSLVFSGGTLRATGNITTSNTVGNATVRQPVILQQTALFDTNGHTITLDSGITGPGGITKTGEGILVLTANAIPSSLPASMAQTNYQGMLTVNQGQVWMNNNQNLGANTTTSITGNGSLVLNNFTSAVVNDFTLSGMGDPSLAGGGALSISAANTNFTGNITLLGDTLITSGTSINPSFTGNILTGNSNLGLNILSGGTLALSGAVTGNGGLTKNGNGTLSLAGNNTYTGTTTLNAGTTTLTSPANIPATAGGNWTIGNNATLTLAILVSGTQSPFNLQNNLSLSGNGSTAGGTAEGAIFNTTGFNTISGNTSLTGNAWVNISSGGLTFAGPVNIGSYTLQITAPTGLGYIPATISGNLSGNGTIQIGQSGAAGQIALSGNNSGFNGTISFFPGVTGSSIIASANDALGSANQTITPGNTLALLGGITLTNNITANGNIVNLSGDNFLPQLLSTVQQTIYSQSGTIHIGGNFSNTSSVLISGTTGFNGTVATIGSNFTMNELTLSAGYFSPGGVGTLQNLSLQSAGWAGGTLVLDLASGNLSDTISLQTTVGVLTAGIFFNDDFGDQGFVGNQTYTIFTDRNGGAQANAPSTFTSNIPGLAGNFSNNGTNILFTTVSTPAAATWSGNTSDQWNIGSNWLSGNQPAAGAAITFAGNQNTSVDTVGNHSTGTISFAPGAASFTISNNTLTVGGRITNNSGVTQTITSNMTYLSSGKSILAESGDLVLGNIALAPITSQNLALTFNGSSNTTVNGSITQNQNGTASIVKTGSGTLTLAGNNTYTGATTVNSGTLLVTGTLGSTPVSVASGAALGGGGSIGGNISFAAGANFVFSNSTLNLTGPETVLSFGNFTIANLLDLPSTTGNQFFTLIASSTGLNNLEAFISTANLGNFGATNNATISGGRTAWFEGTSAGTGLLSTLLLKIADSSTPPAPAELLYWVGSNGTSWLAADNWSASANATLGNATLATNGTQSVTFASTGANATTTGSSVLNANATITGLVVTTSQPVSIGGTGILTISGNLATAIAVESTAGNVSITTPLVLAGTSNTISVNGTSPTVTIATIGGANGLVKTGNGTLTLNGNSTYTGGTTISGGTLAISSGAITGDITNNAALAFNQTADGTFEGDISGSGSVAKNGSGTLTLNGTLTHSGATTVNSGTLASGNLTNSTLVLQNGAAYSPGAVNTIDTISVGGITLNGGDILYNLGNATNDRINASGNATLTGPVVFDFSNLGYAAGNFTVLSGNGVSSFNTANLHYHAVGNFTVSGNFVLSGNDLLFVTAAPPPGTDYTWTGGAGNGNWSDNNNWMTPPIAGATVHFAGANQTAVDTVGNQTVGGIVFNAGASAFTISNNTIALAGNVENDSANIQTINSDITLATNALFAADSGDLAFGGAIGFGANATFLTVNGANATAITGNITGNGGLLKRGTGTLTLSGVNSFTGPTTINNGNLIVQGGSALLDSGTVTLSSANATFTVNASETIGSLQGGGTTAINAAQTLTIAETGNATYNGSITGSGSLAKTVTGTLTLSGTNAYTGNTAINSGNLATQGNERLSDSSALLVASGAAFQLGGNETLGSIAGAGAIDLQSNTLTAGGDNSTTTFSGNITGSGAFTKAGTGNLTLSGINNYSGSTSVTAGTLLVTGALGATPVMIGNGATLGGTGTLGGNLTLAAGSNLVFDGSNHLAVNGSSVSFGNFSVSNLSGAAVGVGNHTVLGGSAVINSANLNNYGAAQAANYSGNEAYFFTGVGGQTLNLAVVAAVSDIYWVGSNGTDWFAGNNWSNNASAFTGDATFGNSTEDIHFASSGANATTLGNINLSQNATVRNFIVSTNQTVSVNGTATLTLNGTAGTGMHLLATAGNVTFTVPIVVSGGSDIQIDGGALEVASINGTAVHIGTAAGTLFAYNASSNLTFNGSITGAGAFSKRGNGTLTLTGNNTYTGGTTISAGTLTGNTDSLQGNIANSAALVFDQSANGTYSGILSGSGSLTKNGAATLILAGANTNSGATLVNSGTLATQGDERLGNSSALTVAGGAAFQLGGNETLGSIAGAGAIDLQSNRLTAGGDNTSTAFSGNISGNGSFTKSGSGTLTWNGTNSLGGGLGIRGGTLDITGGATTANGVVSVDNLASANATLSLRGSAVLNLAGASSVVIGEGSGDSGTLLVSGNASLNAGPTLQVGANQATGTITQTGGSVTASALVLGSSNGGTGAYTLGGGNLTLGNLTYGSTGSSFTFNGGTLLASANFTATAPVGASTAINSGGATINTGAFNIDWQPALTGNGSLTKQGAGTLSLLGNNTRTGTTVISAGTLAFNSAASQTLAATISGNGSLRQSGSGSLILSGNNTYIGGTTLAAGSIQALRVQSLGNGALTLSSGTLVIGNATINNLNLSGITNLVWSSSNAVVSLANGGNISASGNFTNGGNAGNRTFDLGSGKNLQIGNNTLVSFGTTDFNPTDFLASFSANHSHSGTFQRVGNNLVYNLTGGNATGNIIDNWAGPDTPTWATFLVNGNNGNGTVISEVPAGKTENTVAGLVFSNNGNLVIQQNSALNVTGGVHNVLNGISLVTGGTLATPGNFNKTGSGELDLQNTVIVGGTASVDAGLLSVNGQLSANSVVVNQGGTLGGSGTIVAPGGITIAGTLSPGNSPGVISIVSNPVWTSTATTLLEIASQSNYDRIVVTGTARLAGTLNIVNFGGNDSLAYGQQYPFLTATGGITGEFDTITAPSTFRGRFLNQGTTGTILIAPDTYTRVAVTPNQRRVAKALDSFILAKSGDRETVSIALDLQTAEQYPAAFDAIMPGFYESLPDIVIEQAYTQTQLLNQRMSSVRFGAQGFQYIGVKEQPLKNDKDGKSAVDPKSVSPIVEGPSSTNWNAWVMGVGEFSNARGTSAPNYRNSAGGFLVGADHRFSENFSTGLFAGYQYNYAKYNGGGSNRGNSALFGLYGTYKNEDGYYADSVIGGGYTGFQTRRPIKFSTIDRTARANPGTGQFNAAFNLGKDWTLDKFVVGPLLGLQYTYAGTSAFTEKGADSLDLAVGSQNTSSLRSSLGGRIAYLWDISEGIRLIPEIRAQWMHEFLNNASTITSNLDGGSGPSFGYETSDPYRDSIFGGVGVTAKFGEQWSGSLFYNVNLGNNDFTNNIISADLNFSF